MTRSAHVAGLFHAVLITALLLAGLGDYPLWEDEAVVALYAKNIAQHGVFSGWDGDNLTAPRNASGVDAAFRPLEPPLQYYLCALAFMVFSPTDWSARLPFALGGLAALLLFWRFLRDELPGQPGARQYAFVAAAYSVPILLYLRQCRYFSLTLLLTLLVLFAYRRFAAGQRYGWLVLALSLILLFYTHYLIALAWLVVLLAHALLVAERLWPVIRRAMPMLAVLAAGTLPYVLYFRIFTYHATTPGYTLWWRYPLALLRALRDLNASGFLPWLWALAAAVVLYRNRQSLPLARAGHWLFLAIGFVMVMAVISPQPVNDGLPLPADNWLGRNCPWALFPYFFTVTDGRYWIGAAPLLAGALGVVFWQIAQRRRWLGPLLLALLLLTNAGMWDPVGLLGGGRLRWLLPGYVSEIFNPLPSGTAAMITHLTAVSTPGQTIEVWPSFMSYPFMYALGDRLRFVNLLKRDAGENRTVALPERIFVGGAVPDWQIMVILPHQRREAGAGYAVSECGRYPVYLVQRPELNVHAFTTQEAILWENWRLARRVRPAGQSSAAPVE